MKRLIAIMLIGVMILMTACGGGGGNGSGGSGSSGSGGSSKTASTKEEIKEMVDAFYAPLKTADNYKLSSYYDNELSSVLTKEQDKIHMEMIDEEFGYDYFGFVEDGKKYIISDDRTLIEDEFAYDMAADSMELLFQMALYGYLEADVEGAAYSATQDGDKELVTVVKAESDGTEVTITTTGKKDGSDVSEILSEMKIGDETIATKYEFAYGEHVELPEYSVPKAYDNLPHVESPYKTFGDIIDKLGEDEFLSYYFIDNQLIVIDENEGRHYQLSAIVDREVVDEYDALDFMSDDYEQKVNELIGKIEIEDCIDFTDEIMTGAAAEAYIGDEISKMIDEGFEISGYSFWEDENIVYLSKDYMDYLLHVELPEGFDVDAEFEYDDLGGCVVKSIEFSDVEPAALPMR